MLNNANSLIAAALVLVLLTFVVGMRLLFVRVGEMRRKRIHPQVVATASQMATRLEETQAADNFRNLFETPVLFYALVAVALATAHFPVWLGLGAWGYVVLRLVHSAIHCTYNKVMHRFAVFFASFALVTALWIAFYLTLPMKSAV